MFSELLFSRESVILLSGTSLLLILFATVYRRWLWGVVPQKVAAPRTQGVALIIAGASAVVVLIGFIVTAHVGQMAREALAREGQLYASALAMAVGGELNKIDDAVEAMSGSPWVTIMDTLTPLAVERANSVLDRYCRSLQASVCYLLDTEGVAVVSSNRHTPQSFVGKDYSFRPYFQKALLGNTAYYFALGVTSNVRGYYAAAPVYAASGELAGVAVIKKDVDSLESLCRRLPVSFLVDQDDVVFVASDTLDLFKPLFPLEQQLHEQIAGTRQFGELGTEPLLTKGTNTATVIYRGALHLVTRMESGRKNWSILVLQPLGRLARYRAIGVSMTLLALCVLFLITLPLTWLRTRSWVRSLVRSEERLSVVFRNAPDGIVVLDPGSGKFIECNSLMAGWMGIASDQCDRFTFGDFFETPVAAQGTPLPPFTCANIEGMYRLRTRQDHELREFSVTCGEIILFDRKALLLFVRDITGLLAARRALEFSESRYRELTERIPEIIYEMSPDGTITFVNRTGLERFNLGPQDIAAGINAVSLIAPVDRQRALENVGKVLRGDPFDNHEYLMQRKDGSTFPVIMNSRRMVDDKGKPCGLRGIIIDITDRKRFELELQRADKLNSLGVLAGGIAHDFNNLLTAIWSGLSLVKYSGPLHPMVSDTLGDLEKALERGRDLTMQLLTYSKGGAPVKSTVSLRTILDETARFALSGSTCSIGVTAPADLWPIEADSGQISQVVQNLLLNAAEAMSNGGTISVELQNCTIAPGSQVQLSAGDYVQMRLSDTGHGIKPEHLGRIFDPFFTTKSSGTGLGLATTHSIIARHGGTITVDSTIAKGTVFTVLLPATGKHPEPLVLQKGVRRGWGRVLLMDDDQSVRMMGVKLLEHLGYTVMAVESGEDALKEYQQALNQGSRYDLVIVDLTIPGGMGGKETVGQLLAIDPGVRVLVSSGYSDDQVMANYAQYGFIGVIRKPYSIQELADVVGVALEHRQPD